MTDDDPANDISTATLWRRGPWTAKVIKNEDDDGWAVAMIRAGESEPALVAPWTMGRDKKNPKPLDPSAFNTWVKTASEVIRRHEHHARSRLHRSISFVSSDDRKIQADLDIAPDEDDPHATLTLKLENTGEHLVSTRVEANFKLSVAAVSRYLD